jgi:hypothetical protein
MPHSGAERASRLAQALPEASRRIIDRLKDGLER